MHLTLNDFLKKKQFNDASIFWLIKNENVQVNGKKVSRYFQLSFLDEVQITLNEEENTLYPNFKPLSILYEDEFMLIVFKEKGEEVEPSRYNLVNSLANKVTAYYQTQNILSKIHLVNRLDKMTSGIVILAKNKYIQTLFKNVKIKKEYLASVEGKIDKKGIIKIYIQKEESQVKRIIHDDGKLAITLFKRLSANGEYSIVKIRILTGRTHQIRLSFASIAHPLLGDVLYNEKATSYDLFDLKANHIEFKHPITKKKIKISC